MYFIDKFVVNDMILLYVWDPLIKIQNCSVDRAPTLDASGARTDFFFQ